MTRQDFEKWADSEKIKIASAVSTNFVERDEYGFCEIGANMMADAAYNLLSKEIERLNEEVNEYSRNLKNCNEHCHQSTQKLLKEISEKHEQLKESLLLYNNQTATILKQEQEIERLKAEIKRLEESASKNYSGH